MKLQLLCFYLILTFSVSSQTFHLTQSAFEPVLGDSSQYYRADTSKFLNGMPITLKGPNCVWDYSNLIGLFPMITTTFVSPSSVITATNYPGTTLVQKQGSTYYFLKSVDSPGEQTEILGAETGSLNLNFSNSAIASKYPMAYASTFTDNVSGAFTFSVNGTFTGTISTEIDGYGDLLLPGDVLLGNLLRVKSVQSLNLIVGFFPVGTAVQTTYSYFHASYKFPVLNITYTSISFLTNPPIVTANVTGNSKALVVGVEEVNMNIAELSIFPNPAHKELRIKFDNPTKKSYIVELSDALGRGILRQETGNTSEVEHVLHLENLPKGLYLLKISQGGSSFQKKIVVGDY